MDDPEVSAAVEEPRVAATLTRVAVMLIALVSGLVAISAAARGTTPPILAPYLSATNGQQWFVSPDGAATNDGTLAHPLDLATAISADSPAMPGDTIWLRGGRYAGAFTSALAGTAAAPIVVRQYPGERATIDGAGVHANTFTVRGEHAWYWGFEVTNSDPIRVYDEKVEVNDAAGDDGVRGVGINVFGPHTRFINLVVHDALGGFGLWESAVDAEIYGCLAYNNGVVDAARGHGHGFYIQNRVGTKRIADVIAFGNHATGMKVYAESGYGIGVQFEGVISFNNGVASLTGGPRHKIENLFVGTTDNPADRISVRDSAFYHLPGVLGPNVTLGYQNMDNGGLTVRDNFIIGGSVALTASHWRDAQVTGNTLYAETSENPNSDQSLAKVHQPPDSTYRWDGNTYIDGTRQAFPFTFNDAVTPEGGGNLAWSDWLRSSGFDTTATYVAGAPTGTTVRVRPNQYEPGRANIVIYNWDEVEQVAVDLGAAGLVPGDGYEIRDAQNYFGAPVLSGVYLGTTVAVPLTGLVAGAPVGQVLFPQIHTAPAFGVFVVRKLFDGR
ncbi:MAG: hypothetical protein GEU82_02555 [Luteitalea sp.]|nr:hypothetical protein [Luteitalea sp.]